MSVQVSKSQFKAKALEIFRQIESTGDAVIVTDHGEPKLEIRPYKPDNRNPLDALRGSVLHYEAPLSPAAEGEWEVLQ